MRYLFVLRFFLNSTFGFTQIESKNGFLQSRQVYITTDDFRSENLHNFKKTIAKMPKDSSLRLMIITDPGYYTHTQNLNKALNIIQEGTNEAVEKNQRYWIGKQRILQIHYLGTGGILAIILFGLYRAFIRKRKYSPGVEKKNLKKEFLLQEIHYRVKNNPETIASLVTLQIAKLKSPNFQQIIEETYAKVQHVGMIHLQLYKKAKFKGVVMKEFFRDLGKFILDTFATTDQIEFTIEVDPTECAIDLEIPIGLIVNGVISNSLRYAFPHQKKGIISINRYKNRESLCLEVSDDRIGIGADGTANRTGFGKELIDLLTRQLDPKITSTDSSGAVFSFEFLLNKAA
jgi:two-component sensor histidine kinase